MVQLFQKLAAYVALLSMLSACAATQVALSKKNLDVQTKMSASLFIEPVENENEKTVAVIVKNTSDKPDFNVKQELENSLRAQGYKILASQKDAHFVVQINILQIGKTSPNAAEASLYRGYGMDGVAIGAGAAYVAGGSDKTIVGMGILGGITSVVADSLVKDVYYSLITDVQIKEKMKAGTKAQHVSLHHNQSGTSGGTFVEYSEKSDWKIYQTRVLSSANKVNLDFNDAAEALKSGLVQSISGIL